MEENVLLRMEGICKSFPGVKALDNAQLSVRAGTVHALMGENGAGKSTLMKCLFGIYSKDAGHIYLDGKEIDFKSSREALDNGVAMVHQELNQALKRTVMDNIWLGRYPLVKKGLPFVSDKQSYADTKKVFDDLGINVNPKTVMSTMPVSQRQMVEIAKAVSFNSKVIVFDEPTSSLTETGGRASVPHHQHAQRARLRHHLHLAQDGRDSADFRRCDHHARRPVGRHAPGQRADDGRNHPPDGRPSADQPLPAEGQCCRHGRHFEGGRADCRILAPEETRASMCARAKSSALRAWTAPAAPSCWKTSSAARRANPARFIRMASWWATRPRANPSKTALRW